MALDAGTRLGPYEVLDAVGAGGMGEVYRARDTRLDRIVAIKVLASQHAGATEFRERFDREARAVSALEHPNICALYDVGEQDGTSFLVMQFLEGETLAARLARGSLRPAEALAIAIQVADALDKAHRVGVTHRDLKPGNVMLTRSGTKLLDFGLAKISSKASSPRSPSPLGRSGRIWSDNELSSASTKAEPLTGEGSIVGTWQYMAPEQLEGGEVDARTDIFSFGVMFYEMLTGQKAFKGKSQAGLIGAILKDDPPPVTWAQPVAPAALDRVVRKCLAKEPDNRWQTVHDLLDELKWIAASGSTSVPAVAALPMPLAQRPYGWMAATGVLLLTTMALLALLLVR